jgi:hypothetical protein
MRVEDWLNKYFFQLKHTHKKGSRTIGFYQKIRIV